MELILDRRNRPPVWGPDIDSQELNTIANVVARYPIEIQLEYVLYRIHNQWYIGRTIGPGGTS